MDRVREYARNPYITAGLAFVLGLLIGLFVLGWGLWPVEWYDASTANLRPDLQREYVRLIIQDYGRTGDNAAAMSRWAELGDAGLPALVDVSADPTMDPDLIARFTSLVQSGVAVSPAEPGAQATLPAGTEPTAEPSEDASPFPIWLIVILCLLGLVVLAVLAYLFFMRNKAGGLTLFRSTRQAQEINRQTARTDFVAEGQRTPVAQFMTTYILGDDLYDDSFSIDSTQGEFLGECGVGIADTIGVGDPKKVTAFEVWLFDKNDIQTVTKVLMSEHAFNDANISQRLASKGEPVVIEPGERVLLETQTLVMEARVVDMSYGQGALPSGSFFERMTLELAIWNKLEA